MASAVKKVQNLLNISLLEGPKHAIIKS
jgi:hypothetical protein